MASSFHLFPFFSQIIYIHASLQILTLLPSHIENLWPDLVWPGHKASRPQSECLHWRWPIFEMRCEFCVQKCKYRWEHQGTDPWRPPHTVHWSTLMEQACVGFFFFSKKGDVRHIRHAGFDVKDVCVSFFDSHSLYDPVFSSLFSGVWACLTASLVTDCAAVLLYKAAKSMSRSTYSIFQSLRRYKPTQPSKLVLSKGPGYSEAFFWQWALRQN